MTFKSSFLFKKLIEFLKWIFNFKKRRPFIYKFIIFKFITIIILLNLNFFASYKFYFIIYFFLFTLLLLLFFVLSFIIKKWLIHKASQLDSLKENFNQFNEIKNELINVKKKNIFFNQMLKIYSDNLEVLNEKTYSLINEIRLSKENISGEVQQYQSQLQSLKQQLSTLEQQSERSNKFEENISGEVQQYQSQLQSLKQQLSTLEQQSERSNKFEKNISGEVQQYQSQLQSLKQQLSTLEQQSERSNKFEENISGEVQQYQSQLQSLKQQLSTLEQQSERSNKFEKNISGEVQQYQSQLQSLKKQLSTLEQQSERSNKFEENISGEVQQYQSQLQSLKQQLSTLEQQSEKFNKVINISYGHNRIINSDEIFKNLELLNKQVGLNLDRKLKYTYIAEKFLQLEKNLTGRFASSIENLLFRYILSNSLNKDKINILEIGTLFGISIQLIIKELKLNNIEAYADIVDPLNGFYNKYTDPITGYNISYNIFEDNMKTNGINKKKINVIRKYSTEDRINFKFNPYDIIFIDGDHSYLGVKNDFNLSNANLNKNGILVFDDYKNNQWSGVTEYVDKEVLTNDKFIKIFDAFNLIAFKKIN
jgi:prefoldin subunit 5